MNENKKPTENTVEQGLVESIVSFFTSNKKNIFNILLLLAGTYLIWNTIGLVFDIVGFVAGSFLVLFSLSELKILNLQENFNKILKFLRFK